MLKISLSPIIIISFIFSQIIYRTIILFYSILIYLFIYFLLLLTVPFVQSYSPLFLFLFYSTRQTTNYSTVLEAVQQFSFIIFSILFSSFSKFSSLYSFNYSRNIKRCHISLVGRRDSHLMPASDEFPLIYYSVDV